MTHSLLRRFLPSVCALALTLISVASTPAAAQPASTPTVTAGRGNSGGNSGNSGNSGRGNSGRNRVPELDASTGVAALALLLGGGLVLAGRRRRTA